MPESANKECSLHTLQQSVFPFMDMDEETAQMYEEAAEQYMLNEAQSFYNEWLSRSPEEMEEFVEELRTDQLRQGEIFLSKKRGLLDALFAAFSFGLDTFQPQQLTFDDCSGFAEDARNLCIDGRQVATTLAIATLSQAVHSEQYRR